MSRTLRPAVGARTNLPGDRPAPLLLRRAFIKTFSMKMLGEGLFTTYQLFAARALEPQANGALLAAINLLYLWGAIGLLGLPAVVARFAAIYRFEGDVARLRGLLRACWLVAGIAWMVAMAITMLAGFTGASFADATRSDPALLLIALLLWSLMLVHREFIRALGAMLVADLGFQLIRPALPLLLGLLVLTAHAYSLHAALVHLLVALGVILLLDLLVLGRALSGLRGSATYDGPAWLGQARSLSAVSVLRTLLERADIPLVALLAGAEAAAIYGIASRLAALPGLFLDPLRSALRPTIAVAHRLGDRVQLRALAGLGGAWMTLAGLPILVLLCAFAASLLRLFGADYAAGAVVLVTLSLGKFSNNLFGLSSVMLSMGGRNRAQACACLAAVSATGLLLWLLAPAGGVGVAAVIVASGWLALNLSSLVLVRLQFGFWAIARLDRQGLVDLARFVTHQPAGEALAAGTSPR